LRNLQRRRSHIVRPDECAGCIGRWDGSLCKATPRIKNLKERKPYTIEKPEAIRFYSR